MPQFFHGWRRKIGVMTLVMACVFAAGWVRSIYQEDVLEIKPTQLMVLTLESSTGLMLWSKLYDPQPDSLVLHGFVKAIHWSSKPKQYDASQTFGRIPENFERMPVFTSIIAYANSSGEIVRMWRLIIPYWSLVTPLTLLSAYLLLSKPLKLKSRPTHV